MGEVRPDEDAENGWQEERKMSVMESLSRHNTLSFEVFPPRTEAGRRELLEPDGVLDRLNRESPDFLCCSYGAGGADAGKNLEVLDAVVSTGRSQAMTQLTCAGNTAEGIREQLRSYHARGVSCVMAIQGGEGRMSWGLSDEAELVKLIRREFGNEFLVAADGAPEGEPLGSSLEGEINRLKAIQEVGADFLITRLCWDMDIFHIWLDGIRAAGITLPVMAGVAPVVDQAATIRTALATGGCAIPEELCRLLSDYWIYPNPFVKDPFDAEVERKRTQFREAGAAYTVRQIRLYRRWGVDGIHFLTQNRAEDVLAIARAARDTSF
ncbi:MAG TPA: 5,10-methylenetetrahydrofolate reductase [Clostridiales bacterium]|nr:5,10-methylenetetrahydrofolate reductase [Clostridiales bacterium]